MKSFPFLLLVLVSCVSRSSETTSTSDSLAVGSDTARAPIQPGPVATPLTTDASVPDSLKNNPLAVYHGNYRPSSSSSAEQARMSIVFEGGRTFSYSIDYGVADFCSDTASGRFRLDDSNIGNDPAEPPTDENRSSGLTGQLTFTFGNDRIQVSDGIHTFGVGVCNFSGEFLKCDGVCPEIESEDYGAEEAEGDSVRD